MITKSKQEWVIGEVVKVGFLRLVVEGVVPTPGDYLPDAYLLRKIGGGKLYRFVPHHGLTVEEG